MSPPPVKQKWKLTRLCDLVSSSLLLHPEPAPSPPQQLTREGERHLLLALSTVNKTIRRWDQQEAARELVQETLSDSGEVHSCCLLLEEHPYDGFGCLANMVSVLVGFLDFCSDYVKHSAGNCLEGSPFLLDMVDLVESQGNSTRHLQRQAIYLFLSCSICLSYNRNDGALQCSCKRDECLLGHRVQGCSNHCNCFGLSEISYWFQKCYLNWSLDSNSSSFALSFLEFYMEEDDMLFSILLQLLDAQLIFLKIANLETTELVGVKLFSSIFDPVHLFRLLLFLLHYDHMVLVDYLISKDVGVNCAQYLLRCLHLVSQSWHAFVDDSVYSTKIEKLDCKRQRSSGDKDSDRASASKQCKNGSGCDKEAKNSQKLFLDAKECLYSLKRTVEDLQKKDLFPYNPKPLLRSLARFQELCEQG